MATRRRSPAKWTIADGAFTLRRGTGDIRTKRAFGDCQLHVEWRAPAKIEGEGQGRGNSGVFLMGRYEVQVLDSYNNPRTPMVRRQAFTSNTFHW